jgi:hypothetical protein
VSPNNRVQRAGHDKVHGCGRVAATPNQVMCARVLNEPLTVAYAGRSATPPTGLRLGWGAAAGLAYQQ